MNARTGFISMANTEDFKRALQKSWSLESSTLWSVDVPAAGQCGVTALVANDILNARIVKTRFGLSWHFYNLIDGHRYDFTQSQFEYPIVYDDIPASREEALADTNAQQYDYLREAVIAALLTELDGDNSADPV